MARVPQAFMDRKDLRWFNDSVNDRIRSRLKYKGDFEITEAQADWSALAPTEIAHVYQLTSASEELKKITINDETYHVGDWVIVMNKTIKNDDGTIVDEDGNPAEVEVRKLGSSGMPDGEDDGDGLVWVDGEWKLQPEYGYIAEVTEGRTTYENAEAVDGVDGPPSYILLSDADPVVVGNEYSVFVNGRFAGHGVAMANYGYPRVNLIAPFEYFRTEGGDTGVAFSQEAADLGLVNYPGLNTVDIVEGDVDSLTDYVEFNRGYIPAPIRTYEKLEIIPENDVFKDGDLVYLTKQPMAQSIVRYKLSDDAVADGFEITDDGIYKDNSADDSEPEFWRVGKRYRNGLSWEQLAADEVLEGFYPLITIDVAGGTIWRIALKSVSGEESVKFMPSDTEVTADMFVERATMKYDKENDEFVFVSTDAKFDSNMVPIAADNLEFYLPDNMYDFLD